MSGPIVLNAERLRNTVNLVQADGKSCRQFPAVRGWKKNFLMPDSNIR